MSATSKANAARLKLAGEFKTAQMSGDAEITGTPLRALLYAMYEIQRDAEVEETLLHLMENTTDYMAHKSLMIKMASYLAEKRAGIKGTKTFKPGKDASAARILAEAMSIQRL